MENIIENKIIRKKHAVPKALYVDMGKRLRIIRFELEYTQEHLAEILCMSTAYYGKVERGEHGLSLEKLVILNQRLDIDINYLLTGSKKPETMVSDIIGECPKEKQYDMEQLMIYALKLSK